MVFPISPEVFHRIELRSVSGQKLHPQSSVLLADKVPHHHTSVTLQAIPDDQQLSRKMTRQMTQKMHHLWTSDRSRIQPKIEIVPSHPRHRRKRLPVEMILQNGSLSSRRPSATPVRPLAQSTLVNEYYRAVLPVGFFLSSGQRCLFQRLTAPSSLSKARPIGLWQLHPSRRNNHPTCSGVYRTPKRSSISSATRRVLHSPVSYPKVSGPRLRSDSMVLRSVSLTRGLRPARPAFLSPVRPDSSNACFQRFTDWRWTPTRRATSASCRPFSNNAAARMRRLSNALKSRLTPNGLPMHKTLSQLSTNVTIFYWP